MVFKMPLLKMWCCLANVFFILSIVVQSAAAGSSFFRDRISASPEYRSQHACPARCSDSGPSSTNWQAYRAIDRFSACDEAIFYDFALSDRVDNLETKHRIFACSSYGSDWSNLPADPSGKAPTPWSSSENATYQIGSWPGAIGLSVGVYSSTIISQIRSYLSNGFAPVKGPTIIMASIGRASVGVWIGEGLQNQGIGEFALKTLENALSTPEFSDKAQVAMQYCLPKQSSDHIFGYIATGDGTFGVVQDTLQQWADAKCLAMPSVSDVVGPAVFNTRPFDPIQALSDNSTQGAISASSNSTSATSVAGFSNSTRLTNITSTVASRRSITMLSDSTWPSSGGHSRRSECTTVSVVSGDSCASLAQRCGISGADFTKYNPASNFCATLQPYQHVCCSAGTLPDFAPQMNGDGSCATYTVVANDNCAVIAAKYSLTVDKLNTYNTATWGWQGCSNLWLGTIMCISSGSPPMPAAVKGTVCGPQVPGTAKPGAGVDLASLNPCPLNACCDIFGQCGTTDEFCTISKSSTGAPGTAQPGQNGCISNCGTRIVRSSAPAVYRNLAFYEGYNLGRPCLYQAASQLDTSSSTHILFSFGVFDDKYSVSVGDTLSNYEFESFKRLSGIKRILSIGGWTFSTDPSSYHLFRNGVLPANRQALANNIANFINSHGLDGVNLDWEYPGVSVAYLVS
jgi:LysM repeat protein